VLASSTALKASSALTAHRKLARTTATTIRWSILPQLHLPPHPISSSIVHSFPPFPERKTKVHRHKQWRVRCPFQHTGVSVNLRL
jgi:hypothetical protein